MSIVVVGAAVFAAPSALQHCVAQLRRLQKLTNSHNEARKGTKSETKGAAETEAVAVAGAISFTVAEVSRWERDRPARIVTTNFA